MYMTSTGCFTVLVILFVTGISFYPAHAQVAATTGMMETATTRKIEPATTGKVEETERFFLSAIRDDFEDHKMNVTLIYNIGMNIVQNIDSLFTEQRADTADTELLRDIMMVTRQYNRTVLAYRDILNGSYISNPELKLMIARHTALFEGFVDAKREWDNQWDMTARPYIYKHGLFNNPRMHKTTESKKRYNLYRDPEFRTVLWDRRMFAYDVTYITPMLLESAKAIIDHIDQILVE